MPAFVPPDAAVSARLRLKPFRNRSRTVSKPIANGFGRIRRTSGPPARALRGSRGDITTTEFREASRHGILRGLGLREQLNCGDITMVAPDDKSRTMLCMPLEKLPLWLATINPNKIPDLAIREKVERYQAESAIVLYEYWTKGGSAATDRRVDGLEAAVAGLQAAFGKMADAVAGLADGMSKLADAVRTLQAEPRGVGPDALKDAVRGELAKRTTAAWESAARRGAGSAFCPWFREGQLSEAILL